MALSDAVSFAVGNWTLDESSGTRADSVGSNDLTDNNTVGVGTGKFSNAGDFESTNSEYLSHTDNATLQCGDTDYVIRAWVQLESKSANRVIVSKLDQVGGQLDYELAYVAATDRFKLRVFKGGTDSGITANNFGSPSTATWYLLHAWYDATNNVLGISVNAGTADTTSLSVLDTAGSAEFRIGARPQSGAENYFDGLIDDVVLLKGYILDSTERTEDYNGGTGVAFADWSGGGGVSVAVKAFMHMQKLRRCS